AVPSYLGFKDRAAKAAAQANVRSAIPSIETFYADFNTYVGVDNATTGAKVYDAGLNVTWGAPTQQTLTSYCVKSNVGGFEYYKSGPAGLITLDATPGATPCA
ncbi:MAG: hypothetical protein QOJ43_1134, partial [Gaiellaceae bacterium]|nr:hypothetical protein [Gaiellaceae bacterium]